MRGLAAALTLTFLASAPADAVGRRDCRLGMKLDANGKCVSEKSAAATPAATGSGGPGTGMPALGAPPPDPGAAASSSAAKAAESAPAAKPAAGSGASGAASSTKSGLKELGCPKGFFKTPSGRCARP